MTDVAQYDVVSRRDRPEKSNSTPLNEAYGFGLSFGSVDHALNFHRRSVNDWYCGGALKSFDFADGYEKGEFEIKFEFSTRTDDPKYQFVFFCIPPGDEDRTVRDVADCSFGFKIGAIHTGLDKPVFAGIAQSIEGPDGRGISSFVRVERSKDVHNCWGNFFAAPLDNVFEPTGIVRDGKICALGIDRAGSNGCGISGLVERCAKTLHCLDGERVDLLRERFGQLELMELISSIGVKFDDMGIRFSFVEGFPLSDYALQVFLCSREACDHDQCNLNDLLR